MFKISCNCGVNFFGLLFLLQYKNSACFGGQQLKLTLLNRHYLYNKTPKGFSNFIRKGKETHKKTRLNIPNKNEKS